MATTVMLLVGTALMLAGAECHGTLQDHILKFEPAKDPVIVDKAPAPCCTPDQWEGSVVDVKRKCGIFHSSGLLDHVKLSYDFKNKMIFVNETVMSNGKRKSFTVIANFSGHAFYIITGNKCRNHTIPEKRQMHRACVPPNATFHGSVTYGLAPGLKTNVWMTHGRGFGRKYFAEMVVSQRRCVPIKDTIFSSSWFSKAMTSVEFFNITGGIKNPRVFTPPPQCKKSSEENDDVEEQDELPDTLLHLLDRFTEFE